MKKIIFVALMIASFSCAAAYENCRVANGSVMSCAGWAQSGSEPVLQADGSYHECTISNGQVTSCRGWYQGSAAIMREGSYRSCSISNGQVMSCGTWYQGEAIIGR